MHYVEGFRQRRKLPPNPQPCKLLECQDRITSWIQNNRWISKRYYAHPEVRRE